MAHLEYLGTLGMLSMEYGSSLITEYLTILKVLSSQYSLLPTPY